MPVNILLSFIFGLFFGWILIQVTRAPAKLKGLILGCCSAALCKEKGSPFGAPDACQTYGLAYSSLSLAVPLLGRARQFLPSIAGGVDFRKLFAPSTIAVIVGLILGATPLTKNALTGENAPLRALQESADS
ncbi:hypothetical protein SETIT_2G255300v2 [Setaria italica]|uniref:Uncharacterized protein n=1 Tax=Setaria italica TaxID=4555 RepID=A0A368Q2M9_SETIT|nr:hypothetical protein SETIT_2G255300v2 [Setaria italica]